MRHVIPGPFTPLFAYPAFGQILPDGQELTLHAANSIADVTEADKGLINWDIATSEPAFLYVTELIEGMYTFLSSWSGKVTSDAEAGGYGGFL